LRLNKIGYPEILSAVAYVVEIAAMLFPETQAFFLGINMSERIVLLVGMVILPTLPFLFGRRQLVYSLLCGIFKVSDDEKKLLGRIFGSPKREWSEDKLAKMANFDLNRTRELIARLKKRGLVDTEKTN
jgi:hypothetical protein